MIPAKDFRAERNELPFGERTGAVDRDGRARGAVRDRLLEPDYAIVATDRHPPLASIVG